MNAYVPQGIDAVLIVSALLAVALAAGFLISRLRRTAVARGAAWLLVCGGVAGVERLTAAQPAGFRMLAIISVLLYAMKAVVAVESQASGRPRLRLSNWLGFAALWVGMRPSLFAVLPRASRDGAGKLLRMGAVRLLLGASLAAAARLLWLASEGLLPESGRRLVATVLLLPGLSLMLHFGAFNILAGLWRRAGADCRPLFRAPLLSRSLAEFWGRRWNLAFSEMTAIGVYRPLKARIGAEAATTVAFLLSGLLHELAISVPVKAGFGLPLAYFALHAAAMAVERRWERAGSPMLAAAWRGRMWTIAWIVIPLPILFHPPFLNGCVWPLIGMAEV